MPVVGEADSQFDSFLASGAADAFGVEEDTPEARGILRVANETSLDHLTGPARVANTSARNIVAYRAGEDGEEGTSDDEEIDSLEELDDIYWVGPVAFSKLLAYARAMGYISSGDAGVVDPVDDEATGTLRVRVHIPEAEEDASRWARSITVRVTGGVSPAAVRDEGDYVFSPLPVGSWCVSVSINAVGQTSRCGYEVASGRELLIETSTIHIGELDVMETNLGPALDYVQLTCSDGCAGSWTLHQRSRATWGNHFFAVLPGTYSVTWSLPWIESPDVEVPAGEIQRESIIPEEDHRSFVFLTAIQPGMETSRNNGSTYFSATSRTRPGNFTTSYAPAFAEVGGSVREADPILTFARDQRGEAVEVWHRTDRFSVPIPIEEGEATFHEMQRIEVNHVTIAGTGVDGATTRTVEGEYRIYRVDDEGERTPHSRAHQTGTGVDVVPGQYVVVVSHRELDGGTASNEYELDLR